MTSIGLNPNVLQTQLRPALLPWLHSHGTIANADSTHIVVILFQNTAQRMQLLNGGSAAQSPKNRSTSIISLWDQDRNVWQTKIMGMIRTTVKVQIIRFRFTALINALSLLLGRSRLEAYGRDNNGKSQKAAGWWKQCEMGSILSWFIKKSIVTTSSTSNGNPCSPFLCRISISKLLHPQLLEINDAARTFQLLPHCTLLDQHPCNNMRKYSWWMWWCKQARKGKTPHPYDNMKKGKMNEHEMSENSWKKSSHQNS